MEPRRSDVRSILVASVLSAILGLAMALWSPLTTSGRRTAVVPEEPSLTPAHVYSQIQFPPFAALPKFGPHSTEGDLP